MRDNTGPSNLRPSLVLDFYPNALTLGLSCGGLYSQESLRLMISATCFFGGLSLSFDNFLQRCLRSVAYLNGVPQGAGGGLRVRLSGLLT
jgi:hypothetical protein